MTALGTPTENTPTKPADATGENTKHDEKDYEASKEDSAESESEDEIGPLQKILDKRQVFILFTVLWIFNFALAFSSGIFKVLTPYVTSDFSKHALTATTSVVANITSGIVKLPYAKLLDVWGRPHCMAAMVVFTTVSSAMMAACQNVETYCAAQVLYYIGFFGIQFSFIILIADAIALRYRALVMGFIATPTILAIWACGPAAESVLSNIGFRWGFGIWAILVPIFSVPLLFLMFKYDKQAREAGFIPPRSNNRTIRDGVMHYCKEFDVIGLLLLASGLCFLLLSISIYSYQSEGWKSPMIISFIVVGGLLLITFLLYEKYLAPATFLPWQLIKNRTVVFTNLMALALYGSEGLASAYIYSMLVVAFNQSVTNATYITNVEMVGSSVANVLLGAALRYVNGRIKYYALFIGVPLFILGEGLMISLHIPDPSVGLMILCQILLSVGSGIMYPIEQLSLMAVSHAHTPALLAVETTIVACGKGAGGAIATAIWTGLFRKKLAEYLPTSELINLDDIYGSLEVQSSYTIGTSERTAINRAYGETQRVIFITATSILAVALISVLFWRDIDVKKAKGCRKSVGN
ncbi:major facilitator superfamily transporter [Colletotrichum karsti]|uniref:Major facilitator superfamily transporter n=1 Tax=Colletotrichum karsti TaxID=1095194 RepID=A0A9P6I755_9PEZI|nr:major facilitator superfamily transporter [Colletotrichum karsti]KAF9877224.1 major facilitator superfamily transporter [Colletotrichum karsti]